MFPVFDDEHSWSEGVRCVLYLAGLLYFFLGVSIIADLFMEAIEVITSKTRVVKMGRHNVEVKVWNATIANLTLMALGSSAPEVRVSPHARCSAPPPTPFHSCAEMPLSFCACFDHLLLINIRALRSRSRSFSM